MRLHPTSYRVLDGGVATELSRMGVDLSDTLWSARALIDAPDAIERVHAEYFRAGADVAITASYQASFEGFATRGLD
ncbi:MAG: homocysteine S-methyltransferase family protein, partial [Gemmatimonadaceae bacterium]|nr:homocysteine S-methyltransferase family protein [Gemmatimonadaceae bacterium]